MDRIYPVCILDASEAHVRMKAFSLQIQVHSALFGSARDPWRTKGDRGGVLGRDRVCEASVSSSAGLRDGD